jgi:hypothetical protein
MNASLLEGEYDKDRSGDEKNATDYIELFPRAAGCVGHLVRFGPGDYKHDERDDANRRAEIVNRFSFKLSISTYLIQNTHLHVV